jgi:phosphinothricin acetyltransferase
MSYVNELPFIIRPSAERDVDSMLSIYLQDIKKGLINPNGLGIEMPQVRDLKRRRKNLQNNKYPHLVAEHNGNVVGYAYTVPFKKRPAYRFAVKHSIYVDTNYLNRGVGKRLIPALINACVASGFRQIVCYIDASNSTSIHFHSSLGFSQIGYLKDIGYKYGKLTDCVTMQRSLGDGSVSNP